jgi:hypothetical protein
MGHPVTWLRQGLRLAFAKPGSWAGPTAAHPLLAGILST